MKRHFATPQEVAVIENLFASTPPNQAIPTETLVERTGYHVRVIRDAMAQIVTAGGLPIIADRRGGYQVCTIPQRLVRDIRRLRSHANHTRLRSDGLEAFLIRRGINVGTGDEASGRGERIEPEE
jgi:hypothetical protein